MRTVKRCWRPMVALWIGLSITLCNGAPPGIVVDHIPAATGVYIGSPSLTVWTNGGYIAAHDHFGPKSTEHTKALTAVFASGDHGKSWMKISEIDGQFWSTLFEHRRALYLLGTDRHHGDAIIRCSLDGGKTWTSPTNQLTGRLRDDGQYHCAPVPLVEYGGRLWRAMERRDPPEGWGRTYCAGVLSVPVGSDLLVATNWTFSNFLPGDTNWLDRKFGGWLEGNVVLTREGRLLDILRVETPGYPERAALVQVSADGRMTTFDPATSFINFPGGAKKFTIRYDSESQLYWALATVVPDKHQNRERPSSIRNTLGIVCSKDLREWTIRCLLLYHPDPIKHGFQYVDWLFEGEDIIALCRTAFDDGQGGPHNKHDANFLTFHRFVGFRKLTMTDSVPLVDGSN